MSRYMSSSPPPPGQIPLNAPRPYRSVQLLSEFDGPPLLGRPPMRAMTESPEPEPVHYDPSPAIVDDSESSEEEISEEASSQNTSNKDEETATCLWGDCGSVFTQLASLIEHIHTEHVGVNKSNYFCDWSTCTRRGIPQTSRFALTSHLRSHTKEKPFVCPLPECDKSFTRSDALAKHLRHQHNKSPPAPGRGGSRKRKRLPGDIEVTAVPSTRSLTPTLSTFAFTLNPDGEIMDFSNHQNQFITVNPGAPRDLSTQSPSPHPPYGESIMDTRIMDHSRHDTPDVLPNRLLQQCDPAGKIRGRSPQQAMYLIMKAKLRYAQTEHDRLVEQLRDAKAQLQFEKEGKEYDIDRVLFHLYGDKARQFMNTPPHPETNGKHRPLPVGV